MFLALFLVFFYYYWWWYYFLLFYSSKNGLFFWNNGFLQIKILTFVLFFLTLYLQKKKNVGLGSFFYDSISFLKYTSGFLTDFFFFNYGWARQIRAKPNWKKKWKYFQGMYTYVRQKLIFHSLESEVNCEVGWYFFEFFHSTSSQ